ncbi:MAG TPA: GntR family transcriptional regulator [Rhodocyclaceae bacterium]|nr:MAG: GntR family transcriptional regulator [Betaproteobacteria bacterium CG2_30_68_42]PIV71851.1 MAG: GntR family transcriptional regulator [Rhodocyclales bacterium CG17_big_fil_post_rev_8_21_14_2_50_68_7]PIX75190.1 MAG: GntR family transcriptional regulator [Rhodocyclales bacterium CG_4_10_14_3_um_filter_68_10]PJA57286.1 MAG: GntR family transcriptional regulator [Rhodocyclales bacterium CG_4_9_14_3_um_filter_68_10]HCX34279.1 GntR family transcriptional regulator [Rhodocyclaceae bacterium]
MSPASIARPALYQEVAERLRQRIFAHELAPGAWIDEQALAAQYGISRTPLREALKVLAAEGLVTLKPRRGCYVAELSEHDLDDIFPLMALLEGRCAFEATRRMKPADLRRLVRLHEALERQAAAGDAGRFFEANHEFHSALHELAGNRWLAEVLANLRKVLRLTRRDSLRLDGRLRQSLEEHRGILAAIRERDAERAQALMHAHLLSGRAAVARVRAGRDAPERRHG